MSVKYSFVISVRNGEKILGLILELIFAQIEKSFEVIIVDNGFSDKIKKVAKQWFKVRYFFCEQKGRVIVRNQGVKVVFGEIFVFIDVDVSLDKIWLKKVGEYLDVYYLDVVVISMALS